LATIIHGRPNLLLLDEPTNHLDIESRDALGEALLEFDGAMVLVSHDRHLLESTTDVYYRVHAGSVKVFDGDLEDYSVALSQEKAELARQLANPGAIAAKTKQSVTQKLLLTAADRKSLLQRRTQLANDRKVLEKKLQQQEQAIAKLQAQIAQLDTQLALPDAYEPQQLPNTQKLTQHRQELDAVLQEREEQWIADSEHVETLETQIDEIDSSTA
jgi:ATP-binding cassette subfamily F protein 3